MTRAVTDEGLREYLACAGEALDGLLHAWFLAAVAWAACLAASSEEAQDTPLPFSP